VVEVLAQEREHVELDDVEGEVEAEDHVALQAHIVEGETLLDVSLAVHVRLVVRLDCSLLGSCM
jgi:hypothetical protein